MLSINNGYSNSSCSFKSNNLKKETYTFEKRSHIAVATGLGAIGGISILAELEAWRGMHKFSKKEYIISTLTGALTGLVIGCLGYKKAHSKDNSNNK